jgi:membrane fusion protein, multidrug efflux system
MRKKLPYALAATAAIAAGLYVFFFASANKEQKGPPPIAVKVAAVEKRDVPLNLREVGTIVAYETVAVRSRLDSQVMEVKFKDGDAVQQGELMFVLDDRTIKAQLAQSEANLQRDRAQEENLRRQYIRNQELAKKGYAAQAALDEARAAYEAQRATLGATQAAIESARVQLGYTRITAPISGRTGTINVTTGNTVKANDTTPLVTINQIRPIRAQTALPQQYLDRIRAAMNTGGITVMAEYQGSAEPIKGTLEYIDNAVDQSTGTFAARAVFPNENEVLWPGMFVPLTLTLGTEEGVIAIPEVAIQHGQAGDFIFIAQDGKAVQREIKLRRIQGDMAVLDSGAKEGEQVIIDGMMSLKNGSNITLAP